MMVTIRSSSSAVVGNYVSKQDSHPQTEENIVVSRGGWIS